MEEPAEDVEGKQNLEENRGLEENSDRMINFSTAVAKKRREYKAEDV